MASNTTNFGLTKPAYTDTADISDINGNMDKVDSSLNGLADAIAIVANGNTHAAITSGQYVYVHGHGTLAEGLYTAKSNISANATLSTSNLQADGSGGLNALKGEVNTLNAKSINTLAYNSNNIGYVSFNNGLMMQWGLATIPIGSDRVQVNFPANFNWRIPSISLTPKENNNSAGAVSDLRVFDAGYTKFVIYNKNGNVTNNDIQVYWIAIGTWTNI